MARALLVAAACFLAFVRCPQEFDVQLRTAGKYQQGYAPWRSKERLAAALWRFVWLCIVRQLAHLGYRLDLEPCGVVARGPVVLLAVDIRAFWRLVKCPLVNTDHGHHLTLCRVSTAGEAVKVASALQEIWRRQPRQHGCVGPPLAKEPSLCKTARRVLGLDALAQPLRHAILDAGSKFEPDQRGMHVSL